jgi:hypothetical protein
MFDELQLVTFFKWLPASAKCNMLLPSVFALSQVFLCPSSKGRSALPHTPTEMSVLAVQLYLICANWLSHSN